MEEKDLKPPVPPAGVALGRNVLNVKGDLQAAFRNMGDPMTSEETIKKTLEAQDRDPQA